MEVALLFLVAIPMIEYSLRFWARVIMRLIPRPPAMVVHNCSNCPSRQAQFPAPPPFNPLSPPPPGAATPTAP